MSHEQLTSTDSMTTSLQQARSEVAELLAQHGITPEAQERFQLLRQSVALRKEALGALATAK